MPTFKVKRPLTQAEQRDYLLKFSPKEAIVRMFNVVNDVHYPLDYFDISPPQPLDGGLTQVTLTTRSSAGANDFLGKPFSVTFSYHRVDLTDYIGDALEGWSPALPTSTQVILDQISQVKQQHFWLQDIVLEYIDNRNADPYVLKAKAESWRWSGTFTLPIGQFTDLAPLVNDALPNGLENLSVTLYRPNYNDTTVDVNATYVGGLVGYTLDYIDSLKNLPLEERTIPANAQATFTTPQQIFTITIDLAAPHPVQQFKDLTLTELIGTGFDQGNWTIVDTPDRYSISGCVFEGVVDTPEGITPYPERNKAFHFTMGGYNTDFPEGSPFYLPFSEYAFHYANLELDQTVFGANRLVANHAVSLTDATHSNSFILTLSVGDTLVHWQIDGENIGGNYSDDGFSLEALNAPLWHCQTDRTYRNLYGAVVKYNGPIRPTDAGSVIKGLDHVLVVTLDAEYCSLYQGDFPIYYSALPY